MSLATRVTAAMSALFGPGDALAARSYEAGKSTRVNRKGWAGASNADADAALVPALQTIRNRCRYELRNNGIARGLVNTYGDDICGEGGPRLQVLSDSDTFNESLESGWCDWSEVCDLSGKQHFADMLKSSVKQFPWAGEFLWQKTTDRTPGGPVSLRLLRIHPDRISSPWDKLSNPNERGGVLVDENGKPVEYYVLKRNPGTLGAWGPGMLVSPLAYDTVPAASVIHAFQCDEPGQARGEPLLASVLENFSHLRQFVTDTLLAARMAAMLSGFLYTKNTQFTPSNSDTSEVPLEIFDMEPATVQMLPEGWEFSQTTPTQPGAQFDQFRKAMLSEVGRPMSMPYLRIACDASGHNYSSARLDLLGYWAAVKCVRAWLTRAVCNPVLREVAAELRLAGQFKAIPMQWKAKWVWPALPTVDEVKAANAQQIRLQSGVTTLARECMADGEDWEETTEQRGIEFAKCADLHLPPPGGVVPTGSPAATAPADAAGDEPTTNPEASSDEVLDEAA